MDMINNTEKNMNISEKEFTDVKNKKKFVKSEAHPCQYCGKTCYGMQCKECHLKMSQINNADCVDCKVSFKALKKDGTKRKRCFECQKIYSQTYYGQCVDCNGTFRCVLDDGRSFDKCFKCYNEVRDERKKKYENSKDEGNTKICNSKDCENSTKFAFCSSCFKNKKRVDDTYMVSKCIVCNYRISGNYKFCSDDCKQTYN